MPAARYDLYIDRGATCVLALTWQNSDGSPKNLTGYTAKLQARDKRDPAGSLLTERTSAGGTVVLGGVNGTIVATWTSVETSGFAWDRGWWDLLLTAGDGSKVRLLEGEVSVSEQVTA